MKRNTKSSNLILRFNKNRNCYCINSQTGVTNFLIPKSSTKPKRYTAKFTKVIMNLKNQPNSLMYHTIGFDKYRIVALIPHFPIFSSKELTIILFMM